jgi:hypothetical protein
LDGRGPACGLDSNVVEEDDATAAVDAINDSSEKSGKSSE